MVLRFFELFKNKPYKTMGKKIVSFPVKKVKVILFLSGEEC